MKIKWIRILALFSTICFFFHSLRQLASLMIDDNHDAPRNDQPLIANDQQQEHDFNIPYIQEMKKHNLYLSIRQQRKFFTKKHLIDPHSFPRNKHLLYSTFNWRWWNRWHALILTDNFAFRHIFKNGGTTLERQTNSTHVPRKALKSRRMIATVRDPVDHFLSGWQECGQRFPDYMEWEKTDEKDYNERIQKYLERTQMMVSSAVPCRGRCVCSMHSFPQANFLITRNTTIDPKVVLVGDLRELPGLLSLIGFKYNHSIVAGRNASADAFKKKYFPRKKHLILNETMRQICEFLSLDYFLFDFELPEACTKSF